MYRKLLGIGAGLSGIGIQVSEFIAALRRSGAKQFAAERIRYAICAGLRRLWNALKPAGFYWP